MTTFLTLGLLSGKCSHGANFKYIKYSQNQKLPRIRIRIRVRIRIHHHGCGSADPDTDPKHWFSSYHSCKDSNARFTTLSLKLCKTIYWNLEKIIRKILLCK